MEETIGLSFEYSKELEVTRVMDTIKRLDWYLNNKYRLDWMSFPENFDVNKLTEISEIEVVTAIGKEYDPDKYIYPIETLNQLYGPYGIKLRKFIASLGLPVIPNIFVNLTRYGMGGSYHMPNKVISNIAKHRGNGLLGNVLHEIIHLHIQHLIDKYKIDQWEKEAVVNLLFKTAFPDIGKRNNVPIDTKRIDAIYKENFLDLEKIISLISAVPI